MSRMGVIILHIPKMKSENAKRIPEITLAMLKAGLDAYRAWNPEGEDVSAMIWAVLSAALNESNTRFD